MKPGRIIALLVLLTVLATAAAFLLRSRNTAVARGTPAGSTVQQEQVFTVRGRVVSLDEHSGIVKIAHEEIPNYMPAMTMPFLSRDSNSLRKLKAGDDVVFKLSVTSEDSWISEIEKTSNHPAAAPARADDVSADDRLQAGETVPEFAFVDHNGKARKLSDFAGRFVVLTFIYTRCPLPNFCPLLNKKFAELEDRLEKEFPGQFHLLSVTIDPKHDTPEVLKQYAAIQRSDGANWSFATGTPEQISAIAEAFGLTFNEKNPGLIDHDMRTALIDPEGRVVHVWKSNFWTPYEIRNRIEELVKSKGVALRP